MKNVIELDINLPRERVAALFADPRNTTKWMDDVERYEPISGEPGMPGSTYRLVPKTGKMVFVATVISRQLPDEARLTLDASSVAVSVTGTFVAVSPDRTRLVSEEVFSFKGLFNKLFGFVAQSSIRNAHRRHMEAFKRFAEQQR
jgi:uncharacterized protein YndB with AHSA1/START domain